MRFLDMLANVSRPQRAAAGILGLLIVAGLGFFLVIAPKIDERARLQPKRETLLAEVRRATADEANLRPFRRQAEALQGRLQAAKEQLPSEKEMPKLYRQLTDLATQSGLQLAVFAPKPPVDREDVAEVPISVTAEGTYHQLGNFFSRVSQLPRVVDLSDFRLVGIDRSTGTLRAELTLGTFIFRPEVAATPPPPKAGASSTSLPPSPSGGAATKPRTGQ
jgi:type IV pilus assembly protein PilO